MRQFMSLMLRTAVLTLLLCVSMRGVGYAQGVGAAVSLPNASGEAGTTISLPVTLDNFTNQDILAYSLTVTYDANVLRITDATATGTLSEGALLDLNTNTPGTARLTASTATPITGDGTLLIFTAELINPGTTDLTFDAVDFNEGTPVGSGVAGSVRVDPNVLASIADQTVEGQDGAFAIPVAVSGTPASSVFSYTLNVTYDASVFRVTGVDETGTVSEGSFVSANVSTPGVVTIAASSSSALSTDGTLINLRALPVGAGAANVDVSSFVLNEGNPVGGGASGVVTVNGPISAIVATAPTLSVVGQDGAFTIPVEIAGESTSSVFAYNLSLTYDASVLRITGADAAGTVSEGGFVDANTSTPGQVTVAVSSSAALATSGTLINLQATPVSAGESALDVTSFVVNEGSPTSEGVDGSVTVNAPVADVVASAPTLTTEGQAGAFMIPIDVAGSSSSSVFAYTLNIGYDASIFRVTGVNADETVSAGAIVDANFTTPGVVTLAVSSAQALSLDGTLIKLQALPVGAGTGDVTVDSFVLNEGNPTGEGSNGSVTVNAPISAIVASAPSITTRGGDGAFSIPVSIAGESTTPVIAYNFTMTYDPSILRVTSVDVAGSVSEGAFVEPNLSTPGVVTVAVSSSTALATDGTLFTLNASPFAPGESALDITSFVVNEGSPTSEGIDGDVTIEGNLPIGGVGATVPDIEIGYTPDPISIPVTLSTEGPTADLFSFIFTLDFDPSLVTITGVSTEGTAAEGSLIDVNSGTGTVTVVGTRATPIATSGVLLNLTATVSGVGSSLLTLSNVSFNEGTPPAAAFSGSISVIDIDYEAMLSGLVEVQPVTTSATGTVTADISGNQLKVSGSFSGLSSAVATQLAGGAHIHMGMVGMNGPVIWPLTISLDADSTSGRFLAMNNTFTLDNDQLATLNAGNYYVNIHTANNLGGELRGQLLPVPNSAPEASTIASPADGAALTIEGDGATPFVPAWSAASDPESNTVGYIWQLAADDAFTTMVFQVSTKDTTSFGTDFATVDQLLAGAGVVRGQTVTLWHRAVSTDGSLWTNGPGASVVLTRGVVNATWGATLSGINAVPPNGSTGTGRIEAILEDNALAVQGSFVGLSSPLLPIGDIGPAHLHIAPVGEAGGVAFPLTVTTDDNLSGTFEAANNTFTLSDEQRTAFLAGQFYVNIHTENWPAGELRGQILQLPNAAPGVTDILAPADGAEATVEGTGDTPFNIAWTSVADPDTNAVGYVWQLAADAEFTATVIALPTAGDTTLVLDFATIDGLLEAAGLDVGDSITLWHRAIATDGSLWTVGNGASVTLTRGFVDTAFLQFIHNVPDGPTVALWIDGEIVGTLAYPEATPLMEVPSGTIDVAIANPADSTIFAQSQIDFEFLGTYAALATGLVSAGNLEILDGEIQTAAENADEVDFLVIHGVADAPPVDINVLDDGPNHQVVGSLVDDLAYTDAEGYFSVAAAPVNLQVTTGDGTTELDVFRPDLSGLEGQSLIVIAQGTLAADTTPFEVAAYDLNGNRFVSGVVTSTDPGVELPTEFALDGNYPNPFNPSTTISFDLPNPAEVSVEIYSVLGQRVLTVPAAAFQAGHNRTVRVDGSALASGVYLYRLVAISAADTKVLSGKMTLVK